MDVFSYLCHCSYEQLVQLHPEVDDYRLYYAQVQVHVDSICTFCGYSKTFAVSDIHVVTAQGLLLPRGNEGILPDWEPDLPI